MNITLTVDGPFDAGATLARYRLWGEDPVNDLRAQVFRRVLRVDGALVPYEVRWTGPVDDARLRVRVPRARSARVADAVSAEVRHVFGLDMDLPGFYRMAKGDRALGALVPPLYGLRPTLTPGGLEMLVGSILAQQVNLRFAFTLRARLVRRYGTPVVLGGDHVYAFPDPASLAAASVEALRAMQLSTSKAEAIRGVARSVVDGTLDFPALVASANDDVIERLTSLRGVGRWTAEWFLARCLGRGDVCPAGDLAVRKAFDHYYARGRTLGEEAIRRRARTWGPYQSLAVHYLLAGMRLARPATGGGP